VVALVRGRAHPETRGWVRGRPQTSALARPRCPGREGLRALRGIVPARREASGSQPDVHV